MEFYRTKFSLFKPLLLTVLLLAFAQASLAKKLPFSQRHNVKAFINQMVKKQGFKRAKLVKLFDTMHPQKVVIKSISAPAENFPWFRYQHIFLTPQRINDGVKFWRKNDKILRQVKKRYGIPPQVIVSIIGVETLYGRFQGKFSVFESLSTLAFVYPRRNKFFREELKHYLLLCKELKLDPLKVKGSYAGAMGKPQFMPSSYRRYAVDFNSNKRKDLFSEDGDIIASVANYLNKKGWQSGHPIAVSAKVTGKQFKNIEKTQNKLKPKFKLQKLAHYGIKPNGHHIAKKERALFIPLDVKTKSCHIIHAYWLGFQNFYVITRYNPRVNYAMAVYQLSQAVKLEHRQVLHNLATEKHTTTRTQLHGKKV